jgi:hypothetical protein
MEIQPQQLINPGVYEYTDERRQRLERFKEAVRRSHFLEADEKIRWTMTAYLLKDDQLSEAEKMIISADLNYMLIHQKLEVLQPKG